jgi:hypothetical protein
MIEKRDHEAIRKFNKFFPALEPLKSIQYLHEQLFSLPLSINTFTKRWRNVSTGKKAINKPIVANLLHGLPMMVSAAK